MYVYLVGLFETFDEKQGHLHPRTHTDVIHPLILTRCLVSGQCNNITTQIVVYITMS